MVALVAALVALATYGGCPGDRQDVYPDCNTIPSLVSLCHGPTANQVCSFISFKRVRCVALHTRTSVCQLVCPALPPNVLRVCAMRSRTHTCEIHA